MALEIPKEDVGMKKKFLEAYMYLPHLSATGKMWHTVNF